MNSCFCAHFFSELAITHLILRLCKMQMVSTTTTTTQTNKQQQKRRQRRQKPQLCLSFCWAKMENASQKKSEKTTKFCLVVPPLRSLSLSSSICIWWRQNISCHPFIWVQEKELVVAAAIVIAKAIGTLQYKKYFPAFLLTLTRTKTLSTTLFSKI